MSAPSFKSFPSSLLASNPVPGTGSTSINSSHHTNASVRSGETNREETRSKKRKRAHEQPKKRDIQQTLSEKSDNHGGTELNDVGALERATKGKDVDFFWESTKESRPSYRYDTRGDSFNIQYGSLHAADIPKYYVLQQCKRSVLGLENGWWVVHRGHGTVEITDYHSHLTQSPLTGTAQRRIMIHEQSSEVFVGDERTAESSSDAELEVFDAEGGNGMEQDGTRRSSYQHRVEPQHKILPKSSPSSAAEWLELLEHQLSSGPFEPVKFSSNASFEITTSVLSKALAANSALRQDASLWLQYLRAGEEIWQKARLEEEWNNALKEAGGPDLWMAWLEWRIRAALSAVDDIVNLATRTSEIIAKGLVGEAADNARLRVLWRVVIFFRQAGYSERARAILQAQVELAFNTPSDFINLPMKEKLDYLEEFWDSEAPRIGEPSAVGWSAWRRSSHTSTPTVNPPNGNLHPTDLVDDPYARWALLEAHADEDHWMQNSAEDLDPYATVLFSDVRPFLVPLETEKGRRTARYIYLSLLGLHVPGLVASLSSSSFTLDTNWACTQLAENDFISDLFPSSLSRQHFQDSLIGIRIGRQKQYRDSFGIIREWTLNSRGPLQGIDLEGKTRMWQRFHGDGDFVRRVFEQLGENDEDLEWRTMHLAFESIFDVKRALTLSRKFLSTLQYSILLWACHAKLELIRGKQKDARKIYETVLSSSDKDDPSFYRIWWDYTEMEWLSGSKEKALKLILKAAGQDFSAASGVHVLRAKRYLEECAEKFRTIGSYRLNLIRLRLVLELITGSVESLQKVADKYLTEMCLASEQHETLTVDFLVILYHHSITLRNPFPPNVLRYHVKEGLVHYPENSIILGLHLECKRKEGIQGLKGLIEFEMNKFTRPRSTLRRVEDVYMATWDTSRWPAEMQRVRRDFEVILSSGRMHGSYIIWKIYMELVIRFYGIRSAKDLLYRAIRDFPFVKDLYLIAFGRLRSAFTAAELNGLADIMAERGLRNRFSLEDQLRGWKESRNYKTLKDDEDEGRDSELESVLKNSPLFTHRSSSPSHRTIYPHVSSRPQLNNSEPNSVPSNLLDIISSVKNTQSGGQMNTATIPVPRSQSREEWPETDFDLPDGDLFPPNLELELEKEEDLGSSEESTKFRSLFFTEDTATNLKIQDFIVRPPVFSHDDDDEGVSTIKASGFTVLTNTITESPTEDDFESSFTFPSDLEKLSSRPFSLSHRASKGSMEWGDKDHTSSSTSSSETYSSLGFGAGTSPSTISTSASLPVTDDEIEGDIEGLILPVGLFDSNHGQKELERLLELKKKLPIIEEQSVANLDPEDDFEVGLVIDNDDELSPSRLLGNVRAFTHADAGSRSKSMPAVNRPPSRTKQGSLSGTGWTAGKADNRNAPMSYSGSRRNFQLQSTPSSSSALLKSSHLRGQKSHTGLKSTSPPSNQRRLGRKASLSSLIEASHPRALPENDVQVHGVSAMKSSTHKYNTSTAASRAKVQNTYIRNNQSGIDRNGQSSSRPSTPLNIIGNRSTLPINLSRVKSRTPVSTVFGSALPYPRSSPPLFRLSPLEKNTTCSTPRQPLVTPSTTKLFRRSKRRLYGNGTELDDIEDLPTDRDKEARFSVKPKLSQKNSNGDINKEEREFTKGSIRLRRTMTRSPCPQLPSDASSASPVSLTYGACMLENANTRKRPSNLSLYKALRKPTLIRGLGGPGASKVVAGMRWNPQTLRWEGNEHVLRDFDAVAASSTRPALITHLTGSSIGSPTGSFGSATRIVGNMIFDPVQMCWMSNLPSEEDEPDIFANLGDDEDEVDVSDERGDTIRAQRTQIHLLHKKISNTSNSNASADYCMSDTSTAMRSRSLSESESDRGSRASLVCHVDDKFLETCRAAESQHRAEMKGWLSDPTSSYVKDRSSLYEIRALATRQY